MASFLLVGITAFAMMTGVALAQSSETTTTTHSGSSFTVIPGAIIPDAIAPGSTTQTEHTRTDTDSNGDTQTRSRTQTTTPDGERTTTHSTTTEY
jgi:hypothetical protein